MSIPPASMHACIVTRCLHFSLSRSSKLVYSGKHDKPKITLLEVPVSIFGRGWGFSPWHPDHKIPPYPLSPKWGSGIDYLV